MTTIPSEEKIKNLRAVAKVMTVHEGWRGAMNELALNVHHVGSCLTNPSARFAFATSLNSKFAASFSEAASAAGLNLTEEQVDELVSALMIGALDLADTFPATGAMS